MDVLDTVWGWAALALLVLVLGLPLGLQARRLGTLDREDAARLDRWRARCRTAGAAERRALESLIGRVTRLKSRWFLEAGDLNVAAHSRALVLEVARAFHPEAAQPLAQARLGPLLHAFLDLEQALVSLTRLPAFAPLARVRWRHLETLKAAWRKKQAWEQSAFGRAAARFHLWFLVKGVYALLRSGDALFWAAKSGGFVFYDVLLKRLLVRWYLNLGDVALKVYGARSLDAALSEDEVLADLESLHEPPPEEVDWPPALRERVEQSRHALLYHPRPLSLGEIQDRLAGLVRDIAAFHHPDSPDPLKEAALYDLVLSLARLCESLAALEKKPVIHKMLNLRLSHLLKVKAAAEGLLESQWYDFLKKYRVGPALKYTRLAYRAFKKGGPGVLFKDVAYTVAREGGKRWLALYLHGKLAREADRVYRPASGPAAQAGKSNR